MSVFGSTRSWFSAMGPRSRPLVLSVAALPALTLLQAAPASAAVSAPAFVGPSAARAAVVKKADPVAARPDVVSAQVSARAQGSAVEVESLRSATSSTWVNPDGTMTSQVHEGQIRF